MPLSTVQSRGFCEEVDSISASFVEHSVSTAALPAFCVACSVQCKVNEGRGLRCNHATCGTQCVAESRCEVCGVQHSGLCV